MRRKINKFTDFRVVWDTPGQTCNRLWSYLDTVAWAVSHNRKVYILFWDKDIRHFDGLRKSKYVSFPFYCKRLMDFMGEERYTGIVQKIFGNRVATSLYRRCKRGVFVSGWEKRADSTYFPQVKDRIKEIYRPNQYVINDIKPTIDRYKADGYFVIGVHIRRGDYKTWEGGKYYFEHQEYAEQMEAVANLYKDKKICFVISTNEKYDRDIFSRFTICDLKSTTAIHDLYALSLCDRIIGPLSTFSRWASFYGNVPLCFINRGEPIEKDERFSVVESFYRFQNGNAIINLTDKS